MAAVVVAVASNAHHLMAQAEQSAVFVDFSYNFGDSYLSAADDITALASALSTTINTVFGADITVSAVGTWYPIAGSSDGLLRGVKNGDLLDAWDFGVPAEIADAVDLSAAAKTVYVRAYLTLS